MSVYRITKAEGAFTAPEPVDVRADGVLIHEGYAMFYIGDLWHGNGANNYNGVFHRILAPGTFKEITLVEYEK